MLGLAGSLLALGLRFRRERWAQVASAVFAIGMAHYLVTRPDVFHTAPLAVMVAVLAAWAITDWREPEPRGRESAPRFVSPRWRARVLSAGALAYAIVEGLDRRWLELRTDYAELRLPVADGVRVRTAERAALERAVRHVRATRAGGPIRSTSPPAARISSAPATRSSTCWPDRPNPTATTSRRLES